MSPLIADRGRHEKILTVLQQMDWCLEPICLCPLKPCLDPSFGDSRVFSLALRVLFLALSKSETYFIGLLAGDCLKCSQGLHLDDLSLPHSVPWLAHATLESLTMIAACPWMQSWLDSCNLTRFLLDSLSFNQWFVVVACSHLLVALPLTRLESVLPCLLDSWRRASKTKSIFIDPNSMIHILNHLQHQKPNHFDQFLSNDDLFFLFTLLDMNPIISQKVVFLLSNCLKRGRSIPISLPNQLQLNFLRLVCITADRYPTNEYNVQTMCDLVHNLLLLDSNLDDNAKYRGWINEAKELQSCKFITKKNSYYDQLLAHIQYIVMELQSSGWKKLQSSLCIFLAKSFSFGDSLTEIQSESNHKITDRQLLLILDSLKCPIDASWLPLITYISSLDKRIACISSCCRILVLSDPDAALQVLFNRLKHNNWEIRAVAISYSCLLGESYPDKFIQSNISHMLMKCILDEETHVARAALCLFTKLVNGLDSNTKLALKVCLLSCLENRRDSFLLSDCLQCINSCSDFFDLVDVKMIEGWLGDEEYLVREQAVRFCYNTFVESIRNDGNLFWSSQINILDLLNDPSRVVKTELLKIVKLGRIWGQKEFKQSCDMVDIERLEQQTVPERLYQEAWDMDESVMKEDEELGEGNNVMHCYDC